MVALTIQSLVNFFLECYRKKKYIQQDTTGVHRFGHTLGVKWISDIDKALTDTQSLCHATQGPGVGQMTKQVLERPINTLDTAKNVVIEDKNG